jgi:tRNA-intron endonuclease
MIISGSLVNNHIIVEKAKDIGRLFNKSHFGEMLSNERLQLNLIEGIFLLEENKIKLFHKNKNISFQDLIHIAVKNISDFETKYLIFKDLRNRGLAIKLCEENEKTTFYNIKPRIEKMGKQIFVSTFSERDVFDIDDTESLIDDITKKNGELWYGIADEEGDITYYTLSMIDLRGFLKKITFSKTEGFLLKNRVILFNNNIAKHLFTKEFFGKPFGGGLQLSLVEALYLLEQDVISIYTSDGDQLLMKECIKIIEKSQPDIKFRFVVFKDLKKRGLVVKTGFKFGAHFRAYTKSINETHAEFLIHVVNKEFTSIWAEMSRAVRLAHSVNKEIVFAKVDGKKITYIKIGRLRP